MKETLDTSTEDSVIKNSMASEEAKEYFKLATPMLLTQLAAHATLPPTKARGRARA